MKALAILDEQSLNTFVDEKLLSLLEISDDDMEPVSFSLTTLDRFETPVEGHKVRGITVQSLSNQGDAILLPPAYTHPNIPDVGQETATRETVASIPHLSGFAHHFPKDSDRYETLILIGADAGSAMKTTCHGDTFPWVHETPLGFALVGPPPTESDSETTRALSTKLVATEHYRVQRAPGPSKTRPIDPEDVFRQEPDDELPGRSKEDADFMAIVSNSVRVNNKGHIELPLPLKDKAKPPQNREAVYHRSKATLSKLRRDRTKLSECLKIMDGYLAKGHVEPIPEHSEKPRTYIPVFPVLNENKGKVRLVFDSSAKYKGVSLNDCLLSGPDANNSLLGVLMRFRHEPVAFAADVEHMFHNFSVAPADRDLLCFYWYAENQPDQHISSFRSNVHIFGNTSSPAIATFALRYAATLDCAPDREASRAFIKRKFYVDDALDSRATVEEAISTLKGARDILARVNCRLHKISSTHPEVLRAFPPSEIAKDVDYVDIQESSPQSTLGLKWNLKNDSFQLKCRFKKVPFTRRGVLSVIGAVYDPVNFVCPITLRGRLTQRKILMESHLEGFDWDAPLPAQFKKEWDNWVNELEQLNSISVPRCYKPLGFGTVERIELHVFCDASEQAIGHVIYLRLTNERNEVHVSFVTASSRVAPKGTRSIPRLELCAALNATIATAYVLEEIDLDIDEVRLYSDSRIVLGYLNNQERRFTRYVTTRIERILGTTEVSQWYYVNTDENPADLATKPMSPRDLIRSIWFSGPEFLRVPGEITTPAVETYGYRRTCFLTNCQKPQPFE